MTKPTTPNSPSTTEPNELKQTRPWLRKHYEEKRQRTLQLVKAAVDQLVHEQQTVTIEAICRKSVEVDAEGRGVKKSAILENVEAHAYYSKHSTTYQIAKNRNRKTRRAERTRGGAQPLRIDPNRDVDRARYRYLQLTKAEIVERLLTVEQGYAEVHQQLALLQFELLEIQQMQTKSIAKTSTSQKKTGEREPTNGSTNDA